MINLNSYKKSKLFVSALTSTLLLCLSLGPATLASPSVNEYSVPTSNSYPYGITTGPDGNLWFTEQNSNQIGKITPNGNITEYPIPTTGSQPDGITTGPDGNLWFTEQNSNQIGKITPNGNITEYPIPTANSFPIAITAGPDGNLWFTEAGSSNIGKITPNGTITEYPIPTANSFPIAITAGPDGNLWFTEADGNKIGKITPNGNITEYPIPTTGSQPDGITTGPDGNLWFTEADGNKIGQLVIAPPKPVLSNQTVSLAANTSITVNLVDGVNGVSTSSLSILSKPSHGTATDPPGSLTYTPSAGYTGTDSLVYQLCSSTDSLVCSQATLTFDVKASTATNTTSKVKAPDTGFGAYRSNSLSSVVIYSFASTGLFTLTLGIRKLTKTIHT
jgi:streptogramin lyase